MNYPLTTSILFLIVLYFLYNFFKTEKFITEASSNIKFMTATETAEFINNDSDNYVRTLSQWDLYARKSNLQDDYKKNASNAALDFTDDQKGRFIAACNKADRFFRKTKIDGIDCSKIAAIPWILAQTKNRSYEDGLSHTRENIIFISTTLNEDEDSLVKTMIHEKVHIYERMYPEDMAKYLQINNFTTWKQRLGIPRIRANPDLDSWIYFDESTQKPMVAYYSSDKPHNITDVFLDNNAYEHPYELLAYRIAEQY
jgi:hypothetical protein